MLLCGVGLPIPEEIILVGAGYVSYKNLAHPGLALATCVVAIVAGDLMPFMLGRVFGPKLLRLRLVRGWISQERLANFDDWFKRHGRLTILVARFLTGIRIPAFFTAGSIRMNMVRFLLMDMLGVMISAPVLIWLGMHYGDKIDEVIDWVRTTERGVLILVLTGVLCGAAYVWWRLRRRKRLLGSMDVRETFVGPADLVESELAELDVQDRRQASGDGVKTRRTEEKQPVDLQQIGMPRRAGGEGAGGEEASEEEEPGDPPKSSGGAGVGQQP